MTHPTPVVQALIYDPASETVLLGKRRDTVRPELDGLWELPGGKIEGAESPLTAALREVEEETGVSLEVARVSALLHAGTYTCRHKCGMDVAYLILTYQFWTNGQPVVRHNEEWAAASWLGFDEALQLELTPATRDVLLKLAGRY